MTDQERGPADVPALTVTPADYDCGGCELCRALLELAASAVRNRAAAERRRATITGDD